MAAAMRDTWNLGTSRYCRRLSWVETTNGVAGDTAR
jgi:hypothetical protein